MSRQGALPGGDGGGGRDAPSGGPPRAEAPATRRRVAAVTGLLLLAGAIGFVVAARDRLGGAAAALRDPDPVAVVVLVAAVLVNLALTGTFFHLLYARHGRVGRLEMQAVMAGATLLNYLPLRPGLAGRVAYHRAVNAIPVRTSIGVMVRALALSGLAAAAVAGLAWAGRGEAAVLAGGLAAAAAGLAILAVAAPRLRPWPAAALVRLAEVGCIAARAWAAFTLVGAPIDPAAALALAAVAVVVTMVPFTSNGLGLREWATGLLAPALAGVPMELAVTADLVARGAELLAAGIVGGPALWWLGRRSGRTARAGAGSAPARDGDGDGDGSGHGGDRDHDFGGGDRDGGDRDGGDRDHDFDGGGGGRDDPTPAPAPPPARAADDPPVSRRP